MLINIEYPEAVTNIEDVRLAIEAGDKVGTMLEAEIDELDRNLSVGTAEESGIARREAMLGIKPLDTAKLEDRRMEVLIKWFDLPIYTETTLRKKLDGAMGEGQYELKIDLDKKSVECKIMTVSHQVWRIVREMLDKMVPLDYAILASLWRESAQTTYSGAAISQRKLYNLEATPIHREREVGCEIRHGAALARKKQEIVKEA